MSNVPRFGFSVFTDLAMLLVLHSSAIDLIVGVIILVIAFTNTCLILNYSSFSSPPASWRFRRLSHLVTFLFSFLGDFIGDKSSLFFFFGDLGDFCFGDSGDLGLSGSLREAPISGYLTV